MKKPELTDGSVTEREFFQRFSVAARFQHIVLFTSTTILVLTGIPLFCLARPHYIWWSQSAPPFFLQVECIALIHRIAAVTLMGVAVFHTLYTIYTREGRRELIALLPMPKDFLHVFQNSLYFLHLSEKKPQFGRFTYYEKFDYWAVYWGCVILFLSGFVLWFKEAARFLPWFNYEEAYALAALIHADEAILCALALFIWHFYNVHFKPGTFPGTMLWWHGRISREEMLEHHPEEYGKLQTEEKKIK